MLDPLSSTATDASAGTLASSAYAQLRQEIIGGAQQPGSRLHIKHLCERFGVGLSPMREALNRLSAEGLVRQFDQRGFRVAPLDVEDLRDLTRMRCWLNEAALRAAIMAGDAAWEEALVVAHHRLMRAPRAIDRADGQRSPVWERAHRDFHTTLIATCGSRRMLEQCEALFDAADRFTRWKQRHLLSVWRSMGAKKGSAGTSGADWLARGVHQKYLSELWDVRTECWA